MFGRRPDGRRVKGVDPIIRITPYIMPDRSDAQVFFKHRCDMEILSKYIRRRYSEDGEKFSYMQIIIASYVRAIGKNPCVNRFIMNKQLFARNNCSAAFTMLKNPANADEGEAVAKIKFDLTDTLCDVRDRINAAVEKCRGEQSSPGFIDKLLGAVFAVPGLATFLAAAVRFLDRYGLAPGVLMEELPFYVGMFITNTASIGLHDVNHHIYNWGDVSMFLGMGLPEKVAVTEDGQVRMKRYLPIGVTVDERICSGAHFARFFDDMRHYLSHPEELEKEPDSVLFDTVCKYSEPKPEKA